MTLTVIIFETAAQVVRGLLWWLTIAHSGIPTATSAGKQAREEPWLPLQCAHYSGLP